MKGIKITITQKKSGKKATNCPQKTNQNANDIKTIKRKVLNVRKQEYLYTIRLIERKQEIIYEMSQKKEVKEK